MVPIPEEFLVEVEGLKYVRYAGLIHLAHQAGLKKLSVDVVQHPSAQNSDTAVLKASVEMADGSSYVEVGDASPTSVGDPKLVPHLIRIAATRAKARCLRDALAIGVTSVEELPAVAGPDPHIDVGQVTPSQLKALQVLARKLKLPTEASERFGTLSKREASCLIQSYDRRLSSHKNGSPALAK